MIRRRPHHSQLTGLPRGKGWVDELLSGRFRARVHRGPGGSLGTFATHDEAVDALRHAVPIDESAFDEHTETVGAYLDRFLELGKSRWALRTSRNYESYCENKLKPYLGHLTWAELDQKTIERWWIAMSNDTGRVIHGERTSGAPTTAKVWRFFSQVLRKADDQRLLVHRLREPVPNAGREVAPERYLLTEQQVRNVLRHVPPNRRLLVVLCAVAALRFSEVSSLQLGDVDVENHILTVRRSGTEDPRTGELLTTDTKSRGSRRVISLHPIVTGLIVAHIDEFLSPSSGPTTYLIPTKTGARLRNSNWTKQWRRAVVAAGLGDIRPTVTTHDLRHHGLTEAAHRADSHRDLMEFAGHTSSAASLRYIHRARKSLVHLARPFDIEVDEGDQRPETADRATGGTDDDLRG